MHTFFLDLHNLLRWLVVLVGVAAIVIAWIGAASRGTWTPQQNNLGRLFSISMDIQLLVGLLLYFVFSPLTTGAFSNFGAAMQSDELRFFLVEHFPLMLIAVILVHVGVSRGRKKDSALQAAIFYTAAMAVVLFAIPWWRPLLPGLG